MSGSSAAGANNVGSASTQPRLMRVHNEENDKDLKLSLACRTLRQILPD